MDLLIQDTSKKISDSTILKDIERIGFTKTEISKNKFEQIDNIFSERNHTEGIAMACIAVYRDILVFKKQNKIIGTAKICFGCKQNIIIGTSLNTSEFGQTGDYEKLEKVLH